MLFLIYNEEKYLSLKILFFWFDVKDLTILDTATCNSDDRNHLLSIYKLEHFIIDGDLNLLGTKQIRNSYLLWLNFKFIKSRNLFITFDSKFELNVFKRLFSQDQIQGATIQNYTSNSFTRVPLSQVLSEFKHLQSLRLRNIRNISENSFESLSKLVTLQVSCGWKIVKSDWSKILQTLTAVCKLLRHFSCEFLSDQNKIGDNVDSLIQANPNLVSFRYFGRFVFASALIALQNCCVSISKVVISSVVSDDEIVHFLRKADKLTEFKVYVHYDKKNKWQMITDVNCLIFFTVKNSVMQLYLGSSCSVVLLDMLCHEFKFVLNEIQTSGLGLKIKYGTTISAILLIKGVTIPVAITKVIAGFIDNMDVTITSRFLNKTSTVDIIKLVTNVTEIHVESWRHAVQFLSTHRDKTRYLRIVRFGQFTTNLKVIAEIVNDVELFQVKCKIETVSWFLDKYQYFFNNADDIAEKFEFVL
jgi:hypothetical protein